MNKKIFVNYNVFFHEKKKIRKINKGIVEDFAETSKTVIIHDIVSNNIEAQKYANHLKSVTFYNKFNQLVQITFEFSQF